MYLHELKMIFQKWKVVLHSCANIKTCSSVPYIPRSRDTIPVYHKNKTTIFMHANLLLLMEQILQWSCLPGREVTIIAFLSLVNFILYLFTCFTKTCYKTQVHDMFRISYKVTTPMKFGISQVGIWRIMRNYLCD